MDCAVVDTKSKKALVLCKIEEEGASPKKVIGEIGNLLLSDALRIGGNDYQFDGIPIVLGVCVKEDGKSGGKAVDIGRRLETLVKTERLRGLEIRVLSETNCSGLTDSVFDEICRIVGKVSA